MSTIADRKYKRYPAALQVFLLSRGESTQMVTADVSLNGVFLRTDSPSNQRQLIQLSIALPDDKLLEVMGMVTRILPIEEVGPDKCGMGVGFFALNEAAKQEWNAYIHALALHTTPGPEGVSLPTPESLSSFDSKKDPLPIRRQHSRHPACFVFRLKDEERAQQFLTNNISKGGMFFKTPLPQKQGVELDLVLIHPKTEQEFRLRSTVVRVEESPNPNLRGMGIEFHKQDDEEAAALEEFIGSGINYLTETNGDIDEPLAQLRKAVELDPASPFALTALAKALVEREQDEEAETLLKQAITNSASYLPALLALKLLLEKQGRQLEAIAQQELIDGVMNSFMDSMNQYGSVDVLDDAPLLPPDEDLKNSFLFQVMENKYARSMTPIPGTKSYVVAAEAPEQPAVLRMIQDQSAPTGEMPSFPDSPQPLSHASPPDDPEQVSANVQDALYASDNDDHGDGHDDDDRGVVLLLDAPKVLPTKGVTDESNAQDALDIFVTSSYLDDLVVSLVDDEVSHLPPATDHCALPLSALGTSPPKASQHNHSSHLHQQISSISSQLKALTAEWSPLEERLHALPLEIGAQEIYQEMIAALGRELRLVSETMQRFHKRTDQDLPLDLSMTIQDPDALKNEA